MVKVIGGRNRRVVFLGNDDQNPVGTVSTITFSSKDMGEAHPRRRIRVGVVYNGAAGNVTSVQVAGVAAAMNAEGAFVGIATLRAQFWTAEVPLGDTGNIVLGGSSMDRAGIYWWADYDMANVAATDDAGTFDTGTVGVDVDALQNGAVFAVGCLSNLNPQTITFSGVDKDAGVAQANFSHAGGHRSGLAAATPHATSVVGFGTTAACAIAIN